MTTEISRVNDTDKEFSDTLLVNGVAKNLTGCTVEFVMSNGTTTAELAATVVSAVAGTVRYIPGVGYPTEPGRYEVYWRVTTTATGKILSFPNDSNHILKLISDLEI